MIRNRVRWGFGLLALLLTLSTVACGGDEPAPVVQPPAPPPAPPPFQPQAVEVALGESGNVTLMTTEEGGFTLNGEEFESGGTVAAENGNNYLLTLADGEWSAAYQATEAMVTLGITEEMVTLTKAEDGSYWIGDMAVTSGETMVSAENGNMYTLSMDEDGMWMATYHALEVMVTLGITEQMVTIKKAEDGSYWIDDMAVTSGETTAMAENGNVYTLSMGEDGMWMATYVEPVQTVMLGTHGGSQMVKKSEDGSYWLGDMTVMNGTVVSGEGGREYTLMMGEDGMWMATYVEPVQNVMLGMHGGSTMVKKSEDGSYWVGDMTVMDGTEIAGEGGRMYTLMMGEDGTWSASYITPMQTVTLGITEQMVTISKAEDGSYWVGDQAVEDGSTATAMNEAGNTNTYSLMMGEDGMWAATYVVYSQDVMLGTTGETATVTRTEDGTYMLGEMTLMDGSTTTAMNEAGNTNTYSLMMGEDGMWAATYVVYSQDVMLGTTGETATVTRTEDGTYMLGEMTLMDGSTTTAMHMGNTNTYSLMMGEDGTWSASYVPEAGTVAIAGLSIPASRAEGGAWSATHPQTGEIVMLTEGGTVDATNPAGYTNTYMLSSDGGTMWTATYQPVMEPVVLGSSGDTATLTRLEDGSWADSEGNAFMSGQEQHAENNNHYVLTYADGTWSATFRPETMEIKGAGIMVFSRENDDMYDIESEGSGNTLAATGTGDITTSTGAMYRVRMMNGMLTGVRFDGAPKGDTVHITVGLYNEDLSRDLQVSYIANDRDTPANELNTKVTVAGENISLGDLLGSGMASKAASAADGAPGEFVNGVVEALMDLRTEAELYARYQAAADDDAGRSAFDARLNSIAERAQEQIDMIFGTNTADGTKKVNLTGDGTIPMEATGAEATDYIRATQTVRGLNRLLDALASADAFVDATKDGNNGVFENALGEDAARKAFSANKSEYMVYFGTTESTRYGAIALKERKSPDYTPSGETEATTETAAFYDTRYAFDGSPDTEDAIEVGKIGAFSYANVNPTLRSRNLLQTGGAVYTGGTVAVTPAGTLYRGDMRIDVNFRQQSVFGRVSELKDKDNNLWKYLDSEVATIYLPRQNYNNLTQFGGEHTVAIPSGAQADMNRGGTGAFKTATIVYASSPGFSTTPAEQPTNARFAGRFIGDDGAEITGTWSLGESEEGGDGSEGNPAQSDSRDIIFGSYGVTRQAGDVDTGPADGTAGGAAKTNVVLPATVAGTSLGATFEGDTDAAGILRLGKRSTGGGNDENNDFELKKIFAKPGADPKATTSNAPKHVDVVVAHIKTQRAIYVIYAEQVGGDSADTTDLANVGRQNAWKSINDFVRDHIFDVTAIAPTDTDTDGVLDPTDIENLSSPLGSYFYPMTRNGKPDDEAALKQIDGLLAAFDDVHAFEAATKRNGGGVFDPEPALDKTASPTADSNPFPLNNNPANADKAIGDIFTRITSQTKLWSLSTDYTRFGVWFRRETDSAVHNWANHASPDDGEATPADTGSTSPGSYGYSWLSQSTYRTDRPVATYPSNGLATYEGKTLVHASNTQIYVGDALIRVNWSPLDTSGATPTATSTIVPIFSNIRKWQDGSLDRLMHGVSGGEQKIVDEIVFRGSTGAALLLTDEEGKLMVSATDAAATVTYTDGTSRTGGAIAASTFMAKFVGSSGDGPLGILGSFQVPGEADGFANSDTALVGSFGADLTSFETLLP